MFIFVHFNSFMYAKFKKVDFDGKINKIDFNEW